MHTSKTMSILYFSSRITMFYLLIVLEFSPGLFSSLNPMELLVDDFVSPEPINNSVCIPAVSLHNLILEMMFLIAAPKSSTA